MRAVPLLVVGLCVLGVSGALAQPRPPVHVQPRPPSYTSYVRAWHTPTPDRTTPLDAAGRPKLVLVGLNTQERVELDPLTEHGGWSSRELDRAAHALREPGSGNEHPIEPRVLDAVYQLETHFHAQEIRVVSGYRTPGVVAGSRSSNHGRGRAVDLVVPGADDAEVAKVARQMGFMGVGIYPVSGFVHVDVRDRSYFWIDISGPGHRNRERGIHADIAARADHDALARGEHGVPALTISTDVAALLGGTVVAPATMQEEDED